LRHRAIDFARRKSDASACMSGETEVQKVAHVI
jgi:hypothetical protein